MSPDEPVHDFKVVSVNSFIDTKTKMAKSMPHEIRFLTPLSEKAIILLGELLKSTGELIWVDNTLVKWNTQDKVFEVTKNRRVYKSYGDIASALRGPE